MSGPVLFLTPVTPAAGGNGLAMRAGLFLEGLARSHRVRVLVAPVFGGARPPGALVARYAAGFEVLDLPDPHDPVADLVARLGTPAGRARATAVHPLPALCRRLTPAVAERIAEAAAGCAAVHVLRLYLAPLLDGLLDGTPAPRPRLLLDLDDDETALRTGTDAAAFARLERHYLPLLDRVLVAAAEDADRLARRSPGLPVTVVPNAVRPPRPGGPAGPRHDLVFVGNLSYGPNVAAAGWLCRQVLPHLPGVTVALVGSAPTAEVRALAAAHGVTLAADVAAVGPWYAGARVALAPLRTGSGTSTKVVEALAHARPVVATPVGLRGLSWLGADGPVLVADTPAGFAAACRRLLDDPGLRTRLGARGRALVGEHATVEQAAGVIDRLLRPTITG